MWRAAAGGHRAGKQIKCVLSPQTLSISLLAPFPLSLVFSLHLISSCPRCRFLLSFVFCLPIVCFFFFFSLPYLGLHLLFLSSAVNFHLIHFFFFCFLLLSVVCPFLCRLPALQCPRLPFTSVAQHFQMKRLHLRNAFAAPCVIWSPMTCFLLASRENREQMSSIFTWGCRVCVFLLLRLFWRKCDSWEWNTRNICRWNSWWSFVFFYADLQLVLVDFQFWQYSGLKKIINN